MAENFRRAIRILVRRRWLILLTTVVVTLGAIAVLLKLPNQYYSEATLLVVQQQVPQRYVVPTTTTAIADALQAMTKEVLSRRRLIAIIDELGLYAKQKERSAPEELVELMLRNIQIQPMEPRQQQDFNAFRIAFTAEDPLVAQKVTSTLTSLFIQENLKTREEQATTTTNFLREQLDLKKQQMAEQEQRLREFKLKYLGELPEQQQGNLGILTGLQAQLQSTMSSIGRAQQQRVYLESLLGSQRRTEPRSHMTGRLPSTAGPDATPVAGSIEAAAAEVTRVYSERAALLGRYTPDHPDVEKADREIALKETGLLALRKEAEAAARARRAAPADGAAPAVPGASRTSAETVEEDAATAQLRSQLEANRVELDNLARDEASFKTAIAQYQSRLNMTPVREQELAGIVRETEALRQDYADLQKKEQESQLARNLERNQRGQQFRLVDAPSFPAIPVSPKRLQLSAAGAAAGIVLGLVLAFVLEMGRQSFHSEQEMRADFAPLPFIVAMPLLRTPREERRRKWRLAGEVCAGMVLISLVTAAEYYVYRFG